MGNENIFTHAAVAPNSSAFRAFVNKPTLPAKRHVKAAMSPKRQSGGRTLYRMTIAPINSSAASMVLNHATKEAIARSDAYAMPFFVRFLSCLMSESGPYALSHHANSLGRGMRGAPARKSTACPDCLALATRQGRPDHRTCSHYYHQE